MYWDNIKTLNRFTPLHNVFEQFGQPKFKLGDRASYYMGNGFVIGYTNRQFKVENSTRIEYGETGEYALSVYFYLKKCDLEKTFNLGISEYKFEGDIIGSPFKIIEDISLSDSLEKIRNLLRPKSCSIYYAEGETRKINKENHLFEFDHNWIKFGNYEFYFFGKSKKAILGGFNYVF